MARKDKSMKQPCLQGMSKSLLGVGSVLHYLEVTSPWGEDPETWLESLPVMARSLIYMTAKKLLMSGCGDLANCLLPVEQDK